MAKNIVGSWAVAVSTMVGWRNIAITLIEIFVLQIVDRFCQLSEVPSSNYIFPILEISDGALGNCGLAREQLCRKLFRLCPDFVQILFVNYSFVLAESFVRWV
jgi:hypothetical protein